MERRHYRDKQCTGTNEKEKYNTVILVIKGESSKYQFLIYHLLFLLSLAVFYCTLISNYYFCAIFLFGFILILLENLIKKFIRQRDRLFGYPYFQEDLYFALVFDLCPSKYRILRSNSSLLKLCRHCPSVCQRLVVGTGSPSDRNTLQVPWIFTAVSGRLLDF